MKHWLFLYTSQLFLVKFMLWWVRKWKVKFLVQWWHAELVSTEAVVRRCSVKKGVLENFAILKRKQLCWSLLIIKNFVNFIKNRLQHGCFPVNIVKFLRTSILRTFADCCFCEYFWFILVHFQWKNLALIFLTLLTIVPSSNATEKLFVQIFSSHFYNDSPKVINVKFLNMLQNGAKHIFY